MKCMDLITDVGTGHTRYPEATVHGHREFAAKDCPGFDVQAWRAGGMAILPGHLYVVG